MEISRVSRFKRLRHLVTTLAFRVHRNKDNCDYVHGKGTFQPVRACARCGGNFCFRKRRPQEQKRLAFARTIGRGNTYPGHVQYSEYAMQWVLRRAQKCPSVTLTLLGHLGLFFSAENPSFRVYTVAAFAHRAVGLLSRRWCTATPSAPPPSMQVSKMRRRFILSCPHRYCEK